MCAFSITTITFYYYVTKDEDECTHFSQTNSKSVKMKTFD